MTNNSDSRVLKDLHTKIENELSRVGILARVFSRAKSENSLEQKFNRELGKYSDRGKKIQDAFGVRIALYFSDDNVIAQKALKNIFEYDSESSTIDIPDKDSFSASRCNLVFRLPNDLSERSSVLTKFPYIDNSFEVQLRTVLSEGWHEVEHDLRYKCQEDWNDHADLSRALNGIYASLESSDWAMLSLFDQLAYRHYKKADWSQMLRTKFRLKVNESLDVNIVNLLNDNREIGKNLYKIDRNKFVSNLLIKKIDLPVTLNNIVYLSNIYFMKEPTITELTPSFIIGLTQEA